MFCICLCSRHGNISWSVGLLFYRSCSLVQSEISWQLLAELLQITPEQVKLLLFKKHYVLLDDMYYIKVLLSFTVCLFVTVVCVEREMLWAGFGGILERQVSPAVLCRNIRLALVTLDDGFISSPICSHRAEHCVERNGKVLNGTMEAQPWTQHEELFSLDPITICQQWLDNNQRNIAHLWRDLIFLLPTDWNTLRLSPVHTPLRPA